MLITRPRTDNREAVERACVCVCVFTEYGISRRLSGARVKSRMQQARECKLERVENGRARVSLLRFTARRNTLIIIQNDESSRINLTRFCLAHCRLFGISHSAIVNFLGFAQLFTTDSAAIDGKRHAFVSQRRVAEALRCGGDSKKRKR